MNPFIEYKYFHLIKSFEEILDTIPINTIPNGHNFEWTRSQMNNIPNGHNNEWTQSRMDTIPNSHNQERTQFQINTISNGHHPEWSENV